MSKQENLLHVVGILSIVLFLAGCSGMSVEPTLTPSLTSIPSSTPKPPTSTSLPPTHTQPPPTPTSIPPTLTITPTEAPAVIIQLEPGKFGHPLWLVVIAGNYKLINGTTLWAGSSIGVTEEWLTFPPGLAIDIEGGDIVLKGKPYTQGTKLIVDEHGNLIAR